MPFFKLWSRLMKSLFATGALYFLHQRAQIIRMRLRQGELLEQMVGERTRDLASEIGQAAYTVLEGGGAVPGYKLVEKRGTRKWAVDDASVRAYLGGHGLTQDQFAPRAQPFHHRLQPRHAIQMFILAT